MPTSARRRIALLLTASVLSVDALAAQGRLGFAISVETDGFFSTTLKRVEITSVVAGTPAQQAGLMAGDEVESVDDTPVAGTKGGDIKAIVDAVKPGDHLRLKVRRKDGEKLIDIVAGESK